MDRPGRTSGEEGSGEESREPHLPCDVRLYEKGGKTKNEHVRDMLDRAVDLQLHRVQTAVSFYESKTAIIRNAIRAYLADPIYVLPSSA